MGLSMWDEGLPLIESNWITATCLELADNFYDEYDRALKDAKIHVYLIAFFSEQPNVKTI